MQYDYNGMRTQKGDTQYYYDSSNNLIGMVKGTHTLLFYYDENNSPTAFTDNGTMHFYIKNLQGDIVKIVNRSGSVIVNYTYDALGKKLSVKDAANNEITDLNNLALINPLRYRGYVYDDETGLYYLQSRYYDPVIGRFINADSYFDTTSGTPISANMFAYCENDYINKIDDTGHVWYHWYWRKTSNGNYSASVTFYYLTNTPTFNFTIRNGIVILPFAKQSNYPYYLTENFWNYSWLERIGDTQALAHAIYTVAKSINIFYLSGRTIIGLDTELLGHYYAFDYHILTEHTYRVEIGSLFFPWSVEFDWNASVFENIYTISLVRLYANRRWLLYPFISGLWWRF